MNYAVGCAFNFQDLFYNFPLDKLKISREECLKIFNSKDRRYFALRIFRNFMKMVINDIIDNNVTFELPTGSLKADIHILSVKGENFKNARLHGAFKDVDYLKSFFTGNLLVLNMYGTGRTRTKPIYLDNTLKQKIVDNTNKGKQYC